MTTAAASHDANANGRKAISKAPPNATAAALCGKYRITGTMRKGATGYLYSAVAAAATAVRDGEEEKEAVGIGSGGAGVVLKVEECAAPKRQMQNEWAVSFTLCIRIAAGYL